MTSRMLESIARVLEELAYDDTDLDECQTLMAAVRLLRKWVREAD